MPANSTIAIQDGKASPVTHTFSPISIREKDGAAYRDLTVSPSGVADRILYRVSEKGNLRTVKLSLVRPRAVTETVNGVVNTRVADFMSVGVTVNIPLTWAEADIKDGRLMTSNLLKDALVLAGVDTGAFVY